MELIKEMIHQLKTGFLLLISFSILTGMIYPLFVTALAQLLFPWQANGSFIEKNNQTVGSELIGQSFTNTNYFWSRPSATSPYPYNAAASSGSNLGPTNPMFLLIIKDRVTQFQKTSLSNQFIPVDLVTASGSGLDPEISPAAAFYQVPRIAKARNKSESEIVVLIQKNIIPRTFGILGEPRINVLKLNLALDKEFNAKNST